MAEVENNEPNASVREDVPEQDLTIQIRGVSKSFGARAAVDDLTFNVGKGEVVGFLGPNGAGKTTTMRLITSFYTPDSGTILVNGIDTQEQDLVTRQSIGYLPENNPLYGDLLVREYLDFVADLRGLSRVQRREGIELAVEEVAIAEYYNRPINELSKGYRQRVGLAQAILHRPSILIMDEPTEGLDPNQRMTTRDLIGSLGEERTVLLSTHVMQEVEVTCQRVLVINRGKLVADSKIEDLLTRAEGRRTVHVEVEGNEVGSGLTKLPGVESVNRLTPINGRKRYVISVSGDEDLRPEIFHLATKRNWVLWDLHEERARLEDIFHTLTAEGETESE